MGTSPSAAPPFLAITSRATLNSILTTLGDREQQRRFVAYQPNRHPHRGNGRIGGRGGVDGLSPEVEGNEGDWYSTSIGTSPDNMAKNRYGDIVAYDATRCLPPLRTTGSGDEPDYVNASLVREVDLGVPKEQLKRRWWVAAQAPISSTVNDFLSLLLTPPTSLAYQLLSSSSSTPPPALPLIRTIVQLTPLVEGRREKCHPYFPPEIGAKWDIPSSSEEGQGVWVKLESKVEKDGARTSELTIGREGNVEGRSVTHVEYLGWRDHGVPDSPSHLVRFMNRVHELNAPSSSSSHSSVDPPILLHCSAGVGRTGTYIAISSLLPFLSLLRTISPSLPPSVLPVPPTPSSHPLGPYPTTSILPNGVPDYVGATIDGLRDQRTTMAQTAEQTQWCYQALLAAWENGLA